MSEMKQRLEAWKKKAGPKVLCTAGEGVSDYVVEMENLLIDADAELSKLAAQLGEAKNNLNAMTARNEGLRDERAAMLAERDANHDAVKTAVFMIDTVLGNTNREESSLIRVMKAAIEVNRLKARNALLAAEARASRALLVVVRDAGGDPCVSVCEGDPMDSSMWPEEQLMAARAAVGEIIEQPGDPK